MGRFGGGVGSRHLARKQTGKERVTIGGWIVDRECRSCSPGIVRWSLLTACQKHSHVEIGLVLSHALASFPTNFALEGLNEGGGLRLIGPMTRPCGTAGVSGGVSWDTFGAKPWQVVSCTFTRSSAHQSISAQCLVMNGILCYQIGSQHPQLDIFLASLEFSMAEPCLISVLLLMSSPRFQVDFASTHL